MEEGECQSQMAESFVRSIWMKPCPIIIPKYSMVGVSKEHLEILKDKLCSHR